MTSSSTLVATVSINYEDFTEGFLTCGTCLCGYDQNEHSPKLLSCSHTICQSCLELIASSPTLNNSTEAGCIKCPICRQNIAIPSGGIGALPPSFLVNQLYDLVNKKPREFIPKCSIHIEQELLFCETCDCVFCDTCNNNIINNDNNNNEESDDSLTTTTTNNINNNNNNNNILSSSSSTTSSSASSTTSSSSSYSSSGNGNVNTINSNQSNIGINHQQHVSPAIQQPTSANTTSSSFTNNNNNNTRQQLQAQSRNNVKQHINEVCTVIPFSTAIKRMSEILNYRSQQCLNKLNEAKDNVQREVQRLESNCSDATRDIEIAFERIKSIVDERERILLEETKKLHEFKKNVLLEQLKTIETEQSTLNTNNSVKINNETDVKNLSKKISDLTEKNDTALALFTPRENCFICFENQNDENSINLIQDSINEFGKIRTSKTYPPYCTSKLKQYSTNLRSIAIVQSIDYEGNYQTFGGDPLQAELKLLVGGSNNQEIDGEIEITDLHNGTYEVSFVPPVAGKYQLFIYIFNRPIKNCPIEFETNNHHNPIAIFGQSSKKGQPDQFDHFSQPASLAINKHNGRVYVLDSFNSRIKVLAQIDSQECPFSFMHHITADTFSRSCTGIALSYPSEFNDRRNLDGHGIQNLSLSPSKLQNPNILVTDWRNHIVNELNSDGKLLRQIAHDEMVEPTNIVVDGKGRIFVVDRETILVFDLNGKLILRLTGYKYSEDQYEDSLKNDDDLKKLESISEHKLHIGSDDISNLDNQSDIYGLGYNLTNNKSGRNKSTTGTLDPSFLSSAGNDQEKRPSSKTNTLSSFMSMKRKPKLLPSSSLQRGSKAVLSAASKIRSTFTLSHSTSLVSAASLQSMFNSNTTNIANKQGNIQALDSQSMNIQHHDGLGILGQMQSNKQHRLANNDGPKQTLNSNSQLNRIKDSQQNNNSLNNHPNNNNTNNNHQHHHHNNHNHNQAKGMQGNGLDNPMDDAMLCNGQDENCNQMIEPFGIIRGIAIGPDDELIVADESRIRVLVPASISNNGNNNGPSGGPLSITSLEDEQIDYVFKRELNIRSPSSVSHRAHHNHHHLTSITSQQNHQHQSADRLCGMTYDQASKKLLILFTNFNSGSPYIHIVDYGSGKTKFIIDSHDSKLMRPSCLATWGRYVIVSDMGNDCIKKYRFY